MDLYSGTLTLLFALVVRVGVSFNSYSGAGKPPIFGDYEAQRHWMEITRNLPLNQWYNASKDNDLLYWGLDYPPLTAYHSKIMGHIAELFNPDWVALFKSRGFESYHHKLFMRTTVFVSDLVLYISAVFYFVSYFLRNRSNIEQAVMVTVILSYPGMILIDHGHFQYNCVSLGFTVFSIVFMLKERHLVAAMFFVLALNYKQMSLYHSFPFFFYLLGISYHQKTWIQSFWKLFSIGITVIATFVVCWLPFLTSLESALLVLNRLFPFSRGLFEDKVSNVWCSISVVIKIKNYLSQPRIVQLCLGSTLLACAPTCFNLLRYPTKRKFMFSLINCSLAFFLFSYQVHEKSILIVALPVCLILDLSPLATFWFLFISTFSMYPLLVRDGQSEAYFVLLALFFMLASFRINFKQYPMVVRWTMMLSVVGCIVLHLAFSFFPPPAKLPDLFPLLFSIFSCGHFLLFYGYFLYMQWSSPKVDVMGNVKLSKPKVS